MVFILCNLPVYLPLSREYMPRSWLNNETVVYFVVVSCFINQFNIFLNLHIFEDIPVFSINLLCSAWLCIQVYIWASYFPKYFFLKNNLHRTYLYKFVEELITSVTQSETIKAQKFIQNSMQRVCRDLLKHFAVSDELCV